MHQFPKCLDFGASFTALAVAAAALAPVLIGTGRNTDATSQDSARQSEAGSDLPRGKEASTPRDHSQNR